MKRFLLFLITMDEKAEHDLFHLATSKTPYEYVHKRLAQKLLLEEFARRKLSCPDLDYKQLRDASGFIDSEKKTYTRQNHAAEGVEEQSGVG